MSAVITEAVFLEYIIPSRGDIIPKYSSGEFLRILGGAYAGYFFVNSGDKGASSIDVAAVIIS
ncbi:Uncharacterised protein [Clostridioides difficile]|nr:Uncharacterised protein [Clostridioides difficile]